MGQQNTDERAIYMNLDISVKSMKDGSTPIPSGHYSLV